MTKNFYKQRFANLLFLAIYTIVISGFTYVSYDYFNQKYFFGDWIRIDSSTGTIQATEKTIYGTDNNNFSLPLLERFCNNCVGKKDRFNTSIDALQWVKGSESWRNSEQEIKRILTDEIKIKESDDAFDKTVKIGNYINSITKEMRNEPKIIDYNSHDELWKQVKEKQVGIHCVGLSSLYELFANVAGIPTRTVHIMNSNREGHVLAESYNSQTQSWYVVDPSYRIWYIKNSNGTPLQTKDLLHLYISYKSFSYASVVVANIDGNNHAINQGNFQELSEQFKYFYTDTVLKYEIQNPYFMPLVLSP